MECIRAQTRPRFILSSEKVLGMETEPMLTLSLRMATAQVSPPYVSTPAYGTP